MRKNTAASILATVAVLALFLSYATPAVFASPISPVLNWSPNPTTQGSTTTATYGVSTDSDCPSGGHFSGTLTVVEPDGVSTATVTVGSTLCGTVTLSSIYPTDFTGTAGTKECGTYIATWSGTTSKPGVTFLTEDNFVVTCPTPSPEFPAPVFGIAAVGLVLLLAMRKTKLVKI